QLSDEKLSLEKIGTTLSMHIRVQHWRIAAEGWRQRPLLGWGPDAFHTLSVDDVCAWRTARGEPCDRERYTTAPHAHSLYVSTLVERGVLGLLALAVLLGTWAWTLLRSAASAAQSPLWVASAASLAVVVVGGLFNTTLRVEHGSLALLWFALWVAADRRARTAR
ncbi:MAG TPA: O-antigen ligase family protein, partial [Ramlibacter sp.]|uniref:O-antigen ligase family protein n=1 Tax=Ramlibacter sp. TaxID=1917967 RepID=UPI002D7EA1E6